VIVFLTVVHVIACVFLIISILMQSGKGGGLAEAFSSAENILGAQTNVVMVRVTTAFGIVFLITCISIALLSAKQATSLMTRVPVRPAKAKTVDVDKLFDQAPSQTIILNAEAPAVPAAAVTPEPAKAPEPKAPAAAVK